MWKVLRDGLYEAAGWRRGCPAVAVAVVLVAAGGAAAALPFQYTKARLDSLNPSLKPVDPKGIAVSPDGTQIYVTGTDNRVFRYAPDGSLLGAWGDGGSATGLFDDPRGITVDPYGDVYVADFGNNRVQKFSPTGEFLLAWDSPGAVAVAAADQGDVYVLSTSFAAVTVRGYDGSDRGAFLAHFPLGYTDLYDQVDWYGPPRNTAEAIAAGTAGPLVAGTVAQDRSAAPRHCLASGITGQGPPDLPSTLSGAAVAAFARQGNALSEGFVASLGAPCWGDPFTTDSYGYSGGWLGGPGIAIDPADGSVYVAPVMPLDPPGAFYLHRLTQGPPGQLEGLQPEYVGLPGTIPSADNASWVGWGDIRSLAIDCHSSLYVLTRTRIFRYRAALPSVGSCAVRSRYAVALGEPTLETTKGKPRRLAVRVVCGEDAGCNGVLRMKFLPMDCPRCRIPVGTKTLHSGAGATMDVTLRLGRRARAALRAAKLPDVVVELRQRGSRNVLATVQAAVRLPAAIDLACPGDGLSPDAPLAVTGTVQPAQPGLGLELWLFPPDGTAFRQTASTGADGQFSASLPLGTAGAWSVIARLPGTDRLRTATADCSIATAGAVTTRGPEPGPVTEVPVPGAPLPSTLTLTSCPGTVPLGDQATGSGTFSPALGGEQLMVEFDPPPGSGVAPIDVTATADPDGGFSASAIPPIPGTWSMKASWPGDTQRQPSAAPACSFMVG